MFADVVLQFENITKFALIDYLTKYRDFMKSDYNNIASYYQGASSGISSESISNFNYLLTNGKLLMQQFKNFSNRLSNCGYWELQQYCQDLYDTLEKIKKLPKYFRTSKTVRGYQPYIQIDSNIGGMKTVQDVADEISTDGITEISLIIDNDLQEKDWEIDGLNTISATINNRTDISVTTILEQPIGNKVYGKDLNRKITIKDGDLDVVKYEDNVEQKCDILLSLNKGDIPENKAFGRTRIEGNNANNYNYAQLISDLQTIFLQDDLFESISIDDISFNNGDLYIICNIQTKYQYSTKKTIKI